MSEIVTERRRAHRVRRVGSARRNAGADDPGPRHERAGLGAAARRVRSAAPLHRDRQPRHRPLRRAARPVRPRADGRTTRSRCSTPRASSARTSSARRWAASSRRSSACCTPIACSRWRSRAPRAGTTTGAASCSRNGPSVVTERGMRALTDDGHALAHRPAPAAPVRRVRQRARPRARCRRSPQPFAAQVDAILAMPDEHARRAAHDHRADARDHRFAGHAHPARRRRGAGRADLESRLYVLRGAAHGLMAEAPNAFNDAVLRFLDEVDARRRRARVVTVSAGTGRRAARGDARATS